MIEFGNVGEKINSQWVFIILYTYLPPENIAPIKTMLNRILPIDDDKMQLYLYRCR